MVQHCTKPQNDNIRFLGISREMTSGYSQLMPGKADRPMC